MVNNSQPTVALIYDRANTPYGGAENVLLALHQAFPKAPLYTSFASPHHAPWLKKFTKVYTSNWNKISPLRAKHRWLAMLMPLIFENFDLSTYDIIVSITSAEAKGIITYPKQLHICYLLTPSRYLYQDKQHSLDSHWLPRLPLMRQLAKVLLNYLTWWDQAAIFRPDVIIPISQRVAERAKKFYSTIKLEPVIYPPVNHKQLTNRNPIDKPMFGITNYLLIISRLVSHKKIELAIEACGQLNKNLIVVGCGPMKNSLVRLARRHKNTILFFKSASQTQLINLYQHCQALLMPGKEDFGIVALEANYFGKPVIINAKSGAAELIKPGIHGVHVQNETVKATITAIKQLTNFKFSATKIKRNPLQYDTDIFIKKFIKVVDQHWQLVLKTNKINSKIKRINND